MTSTGHVSEKYYKKYLIHNHYAFLHTLFVGGTSLTLNPCIEAANCNTKVTKNLFRLLSNIFLPTATSHQLKRIQLVAKLTRCFPY